MSCASENGTMFGVSAVDMSLSHIFSPLISFSYGQYSYAIVIDIKGKTNIVYVSAQPGTPVLSSTQNLTLIFKCQN